jgi:hypothetical protein
MTTFPPPVPFPPPAPPSPWQHIEDFGRRLNVKSAILLAVWAAFMVWTLWGTASNGLALLAPAQSSNPYQFSFAAPLFSLNLWGVVAGLAFGLGVVNPFGWLNGKRLVFVCIAPYGLNASPRHI